MQRINKLDVAAIDPFDRFIHAFVLANASYANSGPGVEGTVCYSDVGRISLGANGIVSIIYNPVCKVDERAVDCVGSVGVFYAGTQNKLP
jgi:hypothetical protein